MRIVLLVIALIGYNTASAYVSRTPSKKHNTQSLVTRARRLHQSTSEGSHFFEEDKSFLTDIGLVEPKEPGMKILDYFSDIVTGLEDEPLPDERTLVPFAQGPGLITKLLQEFLRTTTVAYRPRAWEGLMDRFQKVGALSEVQQASRHREWEELLSIAEVDFSKEYTQTELLDHIDSKLAELDLQHPKPKVSYKDKYKHLLHRETIDPIMVNHGLCYGVSMSYLALVASRLSKNLNIPLSEIAEVFIAHLDQVLKDRVDSEFTPIEELRRDEELRKQNLLLPAPKKVVNEILPPIDDKAFHRDSEYLQTFGTIFTLSFDQDPQRLKASGIQAQSRRSKSVNIYHAAASRSGDVVKRIKELITSWLPVVNSFSMVQFSVPGHILAMVIKRTAKATIYQFFEPNGGFYTTSNLENIARVIGSLFQHERYILNFGRHTWLVSEELRDECLRAIVKNLEVSEETKRGYLSNLLAIPGDTKGVAECFENSVEQIHTTVLDGVPILPFEV